MARARHGEPLPPCFLHQQPSTNRLLCSTANSQERQPAEIRYCHGLGDWPRGPLAERLTRRLVWARKAQKSDADHRRRCAASIMSAPGTRNIVIKDEPKMLRSPAQAKIAHNKDGKPSKARSRVLASIPTPE